MEFLTVAAVQGYVEAVDVENGEYEAWDALSRCLELGVGTPKAAWLKMVLTEDCAPEERFAALKNRAEKCTHWEGLSKRLRRWFRRS